MSPSSTRKTTEKGRKAYLNALNAIKSESTENKRPDACVYTPLDDLDFISDQGVPEDDVDEKRSPDADAYDELITEIDRLNLEVAMLSNENLEIMKNQLALIEDYTGLSKTAHNLALSHAALASSAAALIERWHTPKWKYVEHTSVFIAALERALRSSDDVLSGTPPNNVDNQKNNNNADF